MAALNADRDTRTREGRNLSRPVKAAATIFKGALVALDATGNLVPFAVATTLKADGRARDTVVGGAVDGAVTARVDTGVFRWDNSAAGDLITAADIGNACYGVDDHTVAKTSGGATRSVAGTIMDVDAVGVWVKTGICAG